MQRRNNADQRSRADTSDFLLRPTCSRCDSRSPPPPFADTANTGILLVGVPESRVNLKRLERV